MLTLNGAMEPSEVIVLRLEMQSHLRVRVRVRFRFRVINEYIVSPSFTYNG